MAFARQHLGKLDFAAGRYELREAEVESLPFGGNAFDGAFLCWILEHVADPARTLAEVRAALAAVSDIPGAAPSWLQPIETRVVMLSTGIRSLIALQVLGDDNDALERFAEAAERVIVGTPGATDVQMQREGGGAGAVIGDKQS